MFEQYLLSSVLWSPDEPSGDVAVVEAPVVDIPVVPAGPAAEIAQDSLSEVPAEAPKSQSISMKVFQERLSQESAKAQREADRAAAAERRASEAEALAARLQAGDKPPPTPAPRATTTDSPEFNAAVERRAAQQRMQETRQEIIRNGYATFGAAKFDEAANILQALGLVNDDVIEDVVAVDRQNAHKTLATIAADPENAARLGQMTSRQRIAELTRMTVATAKADPAPSAAAVLDPGAKSTPKTVSKAPAPAPAVQPSSSKTVDWRSDEASDDDFHNGWSQHQAERMKERRR